MARRGFSSKENEDLPKPKITKESLKKAFRIFRFMGPYKMQFIIGMVFLGLTSVTAISFPWLLGNLIKSASSSSEQINQSALLLLLVLALQAVFSYFRVVLFVNVTENTLAAIRKATFSQLIKMPMSFFGQRRVGEINSRISSDLTQIQDTLTTNIAEFFRQFIIIVGGITALFFTSLKLALLMLSVIPVVAILAVVFGKFIRKLSRQVQDSVAHSNTIVEETMQGIANVKSFANEYFEILRYGNSVKQIKELAVKGGKARGTFFSFIVFCVFGAIILLIWYAVTIKLDNAFMVQFMIYTVFVGTSIGGIGEQYSQIQKAIGATDRVMEILDEQPEDIIVSENYQTQLKIQGNVSFEQVQFSYPSRKESQVLKNLSFRVDKGKTIAIVGPSGSGKSTIVSLILRFYDPEKGKILFDGKDAREYALTDLRNNMAIVPQDVLLFGGTIKENIAYGKPNASLDEIKDAARKANAFDFIEGFPEQFDTIVGERGIKLSGGQRQRIAIARAVLKNPSILILDEATSSLDSESERLVQEALDKLMVGRTSFVIAHRLSTIRKADNIIVIDKGELAEMGTHEELIEKSNGIYKNLSRLQYTAELVN